MTSVAKIVKGDDQVYENGGSAAIDGGTIVQATGKLGPSGSLPGFDVAADAAGNVVGITATISVPTSVTPGAGAGTTAYGNYPMFDVSVPDATTTVYSHGIFRATYTAAAVAYGDKVCAATNGQVRKWVSGTDKPEAIIGFCAEPSGVTAAGGVARVKLSI